jgi:hypothetical protein
MTSHNNYKNSEVYRNIASANPRVSIFDNGVNDKGEIDLPIQIANSVSGVNHSSQEKEKSWYKYGDGEILDYVFENTNIKLSRFSTRSMNVWYGSSTIENTFEETVSYIEKVNRLELRELPGKIKDKKLGYIESERALCLATINCNNIYDAKDLKDNIVNYEDTSSYEDCRKVAIRALKRGHEGLIYLSSKSKRNIDCFAIWEKECVVSSNVIDFYTVLVYADETKETLIIKHNNK